MTTPAPVAIVTGASSGIGLATARELSAKGYRIGLIARRSDRLETVAAEIRGLGGDVVVGQADVSDRAALRRAVGTIVGELGPIDVMVANAGFGVPTRLDPLNTADVEQTIRVNLLGVIYSIEVVLPTMLTRRSGQIVAISSLAAFKGLPGESAYCSSKAAVNAYMEGLRLSARGRGIAFATVCPGFVDTPMNTMDSPTPFLMTAEAAARRIARVVAQRRSGVVRFPRRMAVLMSLIGRLPDSVFVRLVGHGPEG
jgi:NADP-dependent 3-hydroxy acid dehydrogenase YdfG